MEVFFDEPDQRRRRKTHRSIEEILNGPEEQDASRPPQPTSVFGTHEPPTDAPTTASTAFGRILNEGASGVAKAVRRHGPIGLTPEDVAELRRRGIFNSERGDPRLPHIVNQMLVGSRTLNEAIIPPAATLFDVGSLAIDAGMHGIHAGGSQALEEAGLSFLNPDLFVRDLLGAIEQHLRRFR